MHRILIVNSPYYAHISEELEKGAREALEASGEPCEIATFHRYIGHVADRSGHELPILRQ